MSRLERLSIERVAYSAAFWTMPVLLKRRCYSLEVCARFAGILPREHGLVRVDDCIYSQQLGLKSSFEIGDLDHFRFRTYPFHGTLAECGMQSDGVWYHCHCMILIYDNKRTCDVPLIHVIY